MKILFEGFAYPAQTLQNVLKNDLLFNTSGTKTITPYVGYYFDEDLGDSVFILPKVFINADNLAFEKFLPLEIIDLDDNDNPLKKSEHYAQMFELSVWLYKAIERFNNRHPQNTVASTKNIQNALNAKGGNQETYLDIILSLLDFYKQNKYLFTFIYKKSKSGNNKINWEKTFAKETPFFNGSTPVYANLSTQKKSVNFDEQLLVLFYSSLDYLKLKFNFKISDYQGFQPIKNKDFSSLLASGKALRILKKIRKNYFSDRLVSLWNLLYIFFDKTEKILNRRYREEMLLIKNFNEVFEDIIDCLISDNDIPYGLKNQKDGKLIDHIYRSSSLTDSENDIYFIGDSKYYKETTEIGENSVYKQFTYAKNVIQFNIDIFNSGNSDGKIRYRDNLTEGYDITPNFFIRGKIFDDFLKLDDTRSLENRHFNNRLFDRDTLILLTYDINFLKVLSAYVLNNEQLYRDKIRNTFRRHIVDYFNKKFDFYKVYPSVSLEDFVNKNFRKYIGKMFCPRDDEDFIWFAFEKGTKDFSEMEGVATIEESAV